MIWKSAKTWQLLEEEMAKEVAEVWGQQDQLLESIPTTGIESITGHEFRSRAHTCPSPRNPTCKETGDNSIVDLSNNASYVQKISLHLDVQVCKV